MNPRIFLLTIGMFASGTNSLIITGVLPEIAAELHTTSGLAGLGVTVYAAAFALSAPFLPIVMRHLERRTIMVVGLLLFICGTVGGILAQDLGMFLAVRAVVGVGGAAFIPQAATVALALADAAHKGRALAIVGLGTTGAIALGSPLGALVGGAWGYRAAFALVGLLGVLGLVALIGVPRTPKSDAIGFSAQLSSLREPRVVLVAITTLLIATAVNSLVTFFAPLFQQTAAVDSTSLAVVLLAFGFASLFSNIVGGPLIDRFGGFAVATVSLAVFLIAIAALALATGFVAVFLLVIPFGFCANLSLPAQQFEIARIEEDAAPALALNSTGLFGGAALGSALGACAITIAPIHYLPFFTLVPATAALALTASQLVRRRRDGLGRPAIG